MNSPGSRLGAVRAEFDKLGLRTFSFFPCDQHIVLWIPSRNLCTDYESDSYDAALAKHLPPFDVVSCMVYSMDTYYEDCQSGRLPRDRCRQRISELLAKERCGGIGRIKAKVLAKTALALGLINDVAGVCESPAASVAPGASAP